GYHILAGQEPERWKIVDATQDPEQVQTEIRALVLNALEEKRI
ncbi:MAG: dTMP kinase, partial [Chloroflexi bacterium]|nr:dTMP kinase [Chloroflexota bacterium]